MTITVDTTGLSANLNALHDAMIGRGQIADAGTLVKDEARLLLKAIIKLTPPKNLAQGRNAIKQDLFGGRNIGGNQRSRGIFFILQNWMENQEASRNTTRLWTTKKGDVFGVENTKYKPSATISEMREHHFRNRSNRTKQVSTAGSRDRQVGRWRFIDRVAVGKTAARRYLLDAGKTVGWMKGGWANSYVALGGKVKAWIGRHVGKAHGQIIELVLTGETPSIAFHNTTKNIGVNIRQIEAAVKQRQIAIARRIKLILSGYSKDVAAGLRAKRKAKSTDI